MRIQACHLCQGHRGNDLRLNRRELIGSLNYATGDCAVFSLLEDLDDFIRVGCTDNQSLNDVQAFLGFAQVKLRAAR